MTAPAREAGSSGRPRARTATPAPERIERGTDRGTTLAPERTTGGRGRSVAAEKAYARRAQRSARDAGTPQRKPERRPGSAGRVTFVLLVMALLIIGVAATLWFATQAAADAYKLEQARNATTQLSGRVEQLQRQVAQQNSPPSLEQRARQLGMVPAGDAAHLVVGADGKVTVIGTPSAITSPPAPSTSSSSSSSSSTSSPTGTTTVPPAGH